MKAKDKITGKIIEVTPAFGGYFVCKGNLIPQGDLEFNFDPSQPEATISGWVARDKDKTLNFHTKRPNRMDFGKWTYSQYPLTFSIFPSLTWQDEPVEVEITIKLKKI